MPRHRPLCPARGRRRAGAELHRAADPARDQSYFLFATTREQLDYLRFPLGGLPKPAVREIARELGLVVADKPDSQDICFVPERRLCLGREEGAARGGAAGRDRRPRGAGARPRIAASSISPSASAAASSIGGQAEPLYVVRLEPEARRVVVGPKAALAVRAARLSGLNWLGEEQSDGLSAKVRSMARPGAGRASTATSLHFDAPEYGVAPGQAAVIYEGSRVLGGGWIEETMPFRAESLAAA